MSFLKKIKENKWYKGIAYFFPLQLFLLHLKRNQLLLFFWALLFGYITQTIGSKYGVPYLFLEPEYMGGVGMRSHFLLGFCIGLFIMAFNVSSYIISGTTFPFIVTLYRPILKYSINNSVIPILFIICYICNSTLFQLNQSYSNLLEVLSNQLAFIIGVIAFLMLTFSYFFSTIKNIFKIFGIKEDINGNPKLPINIDKYDKRKRLKIRKWRIETYLSGKFKIRRVRNANHYSRSMIENVFRQNHSNAALFQILTFGILLFLGWFRDNTYFTIPAGGSIVIITSVFLLIFSAIHYWLRGWSTSILIFCFLLFNLFPKYNILKPMTKAYGLKYSTYNNYNKQNLQADKYEIASDYKKGQKILFNWKQKNKTVNGVKPKLIIINPSGGGLRSAVWTFLALQHGDSITNGKLLKQAHLISGSSGGMLGASYLRELYLRKQKNQITDFYSNKYVTNIGQDLLNPIAYSIAVNDLFVSLQNFNLNGEVHQKDRAYAFESKFNINTHSILNKRIIDYRIDEEYANIPLMFISATNINDGKRFIISPQEIAYINNKALETGSSNMPMSDEIEFSKLFKHQGAKNLRFTSALRMSATFPYILPAVSLPSQPEAVVMDAGGRDNFGFELSLKYLYTYRNWIAKNTGGIVIIQTRGKEQANETKEKNNTIINRIIKPLGSMYENLSNIHNYNHDQLLQYASSWFNGTIDVINLTIDSQDENVSLSWHLTQKEKDAITNSVNSNKNIEAYQKLLDLLN